MYFEINVSLNGKHFFATAERSITDRTKLTDVYNAFVYKFPESEGYSIAVAQYETVGKYINPLGE